MRGLIFKHRVHLVGDADGCDAAPQVDRHSRPQLRDEAVAEKSFCETTPAVKSRGRRPYVAAILSEIHPPTSALPPSELLPTADGTAGQGHENDDDRSKSMCGILFAVLQEFLFPKP